MGLQSKPVLFAVGLIAAIALILLTLHSYRHRFVREDRDVLALLPEGDATTFFADVSALRSAGMLEMLSGSKPAGEADYRQFIRETQFDYTKDLEAVAGSVAGGQVFFVLRGRFDWNRLRTYAQAHGGSCRRDICEVPASKPGRWTSFLLVQPDVMAVALSPNDTAVEQLRPHGSPTVVPLPSPNPIWVKMSNSLLKNPLSLPPGMRIFAVSLQSANQVILSIGRASEFSRAAFEVQLDARCPNVATAETARNQLELQTKMLSLELAREHAQPNAADLTGLLTAGAFRVVGNRVVGIWPVPKELLKTLQ